MKTQQCQVSIILPTLRPEVVKNCLERIYHTTKNLDYEIILVTPIIGIKDKLRECKAFDYIKVIEEQEKAGVSRAFELAIPHIKGEYIFLLSDDQLIQTDCILNLYEYSKNQEIDRENFIVTGPRYTSVWGSHWDETIFDLYYPCNPFFHKEILKSVDNVIFDTYLTNYYGDPDFALRARDKGYPVIPCPTAWMENTNAFDEVEKERRDDNFNNDHDNFVKRWESKFDVPDNSSAQINKGKSIQGGGISSEFCSRIMHHIQHEDFECIVGEISLRENINATTHYYLEEQYVSDVFGYIVSMGKLFPTFLKTRNYPLQRNLFRLFLSEMKNPVLDFKTVINKAKWIDSEIVRNLIMSGYIIYLKNKKEGKTDFIFIKDYKDTNIGYKDKHFYDTVHNLKTTTFCEMIGLLDDISSKFPVIDYLELKLFETYLSNNQISFQYMFNALEYFTNKKIDERRKGKFDAYTWDFK